MNKFESGCLEMMLKLPTKKKSWLCVKREKKRSTSWASYTFSVSEQDHMEDSAGKEYEIQSFSKRKWAKCFRGKAPFIYEINCSERPRKAEPEVWTLDLIVMGTKCCLMTEDRGSMNRVFQDWKASFDIK